MTGFQKGDKVRLDASGVVVSSDKHGTQVKIAVPAVGNGSDNYFFDDSLLTLVERQYRPGDILLTQEDYDLLPDGSMFKVADHAGWVKLLDGRYASLDNGYITVEVSRDRIRTVFYVPA